ncbi:MAG: CHAT domain-containing protein [Cyanobacteriota bacterium]|nr:CHAT domain-containing protein [Cyanobacteriota bacterium]
MKTITAKSLTMAFVPLLGLASSTSVLAQEIVPSGDGTGTSVNLQGDRLDIEGGSRSGDGANLFHSFDRFNLNSGQTANFISAPEIQNILGRIVGGDASIINGLIQITGGNSNLFLMNPAGIIFGPNAGLNIPADFTVTTATAIGFDNNNFWFDTTSVNNYQNLVGNPSGYYFNLPRAGAIVNGGNLSLKPNQNLTLLGGTVINAGQLTTAGGNINIAAVDGGNTVRISQEGHLLNLEILPLVGEGEFLRQQAEIKPLSLPELLTGGEGVNATEMAVNERGQIVLTAPGIIVREKGGEAIASGEIDVSGSGVGGNVRILGDRVGIIDANIKADGINGGGNIFIGGDFQGNGLIPNSHRTFVNSNSFISASAIENGNGGMVIVWSDGTTRFEGNIRAIGGGNFGDGGFVEVSGKEQLVFRGNVDVSAVNGRPGTILLDPENIEIGGEEEESDRQASQETTEEETTGEETTEEETTTGEETTEEETTTGEETTGEETTEEETTGGETTTGEETTGGETTTGEETTGGETTGGETTGEETTGGETAGGETTTEEETTGEETITGGETTGEETTTGEESAGGETTGEETTGGETPVDPFSQNEAGNVTISAENLGELDGEIILEADNDIVINENIETAGSVSLQAGRSIDINANINTASGNGNIGIFANNENANGDIRSPGAASVNQLAETSLNAGSGDINISLGNLGEIGSINLANLTATGSITIDANGGNITRVSPTSLITAGSGIFRTNGSGAIGSLSEPLRLSVGNLQAFAGSEGAFFQATTALNVAGISAGGGEIQLSAEGDISISGDISSTVASGEGGNIAISSNGGGIDAGQNTIDSSSESGRGGNISLGATGNIRTNNIDASSSGGEGGNIVLETTGGGIESVSLNATSTLGEGGEVSLAAVADINAGNIESSGSLRGGNIQVRSSGGAIATSANLNASSQDGIGGEVNLTAVGEVVTGNVTTAGSLGGGDITLTSETADVDTTAGELDATSSGGSDGNIVINAAENISIRNINIEDGGTDDLFADPPEEEVFADADGVNSGTGEVSLRANNDINILEDISSGSISTLELKAGRDINLNADIDTQAGNGNISLEANWEGADPNIREDGLANVTMAEGTTINAGQGNIEILMGSFGDGSNVGNITLSNVFTLGQLSVDAAGGSIFLTSQDSLITSTTAVLSTLGDGSIGLPNEPLRLSVDNLDATGGSEGVFLSSPTQGMSVGNILTTGGGLVEITVEGDLSVVEGISTFSVESGEAGNIFLDAAGNINTSSANLNASSEEGIGGEVNLTAVGEVVTGNVTTAGSLGGGDITLTSETADVDTTAGELDATSSGGSDGNIVINAAENISIRNINIEDGGTDDLFADPPEEEVFADADGVNSGTGEVSLRANNDINILEDISSGSISTLELKAGRDINLNADIDTQAGNGNISLEANWEGADPNIREDGLANVTMAEGTTINAGQGNIEILMGSFGDGSNVGNITLSNVFTLGQLSVDAAGGSIFLTSQDSLITSTTAVLSTLGDGSIGLPNEPLRLSVDNLDATGGSEGVFLSSPTQGMSVGNILTTGGGLVEITVEGDLSVVEGISTFSVESGEAGNIFLDAAGNIEAANLDSSGSLRGGDIDITSRGGDITATGAIASSSQSGIAGNVTLDAAGSVNILGIEAGGDTSGGNISIISDSENSVNAQQTLTTSSENGSGGNVNIDSNGNVTLAGIAASGRQQGGNATISTRANIDLTGGSVQTSSGEGLAGNVSFNAAGDVDLSDILSGGLQRGGNITITSQGNVDTSFGRLLDASSQTGDGGGVDITATGAIAVREINTSGLESGGQLRLASSQSNIETTGNLNSSSGSGIAGNVTIEAAGDVTLAGDILSTGETAAGRVEIGTTDGNINLGSSNIEAFSEQGAGGSVTLNAPGSVITSNITTFGNSASGDVTISSAENAIDTGTIQTNAQESGPSGSVTLNTFTAEGNIQSANIAADETGEPTGNVEVVAPDGSTQIENIGESNLEPTPTTPGEDSTEPTPTPTGEDSSEPTPTPTGEDSPQLTPTPTGEDSPQLTATPTGEDSPQLTPTPTGEDSPQLTPTPTGEDSPQLQPESSVTEPQLQPESSVTEPQLQPESSVTETQLQPESSVTEPQLQPESSVTETQLQPESSVTETQLQPESSVTETQLTPEGESAIASNTSPSNNETFVLSVQNNNEVVTAVSGSTINTTSNSNSDVARAASSEQFSTSSNNIIEDSNVTSSRTSVRILQTNLSNVNTPTTAASPQQIALIEQTRNSEFSNYFGEDLSNQTLSTVSVRDILSDIAKQTENQSAVIYITAYSNQLQLVLFAPSGDAILKTIPEANREELMKVVKKFREEITKGKNILFRNRKDYLNAAQQLYQWLIAPIEAELQAANIETLLFSMDQGLRALPVAALHDGEQFLVEKYSLSLIPSVSLMDPRYRPLRDTRVLAMGASEFLTQPPLPAVPLELQTITQQVWRGNLFLNQDFTQGNLLEQRRDYPYPIIHLATHAEFQPGDASNSYIQFWEGEQLRLSQIRRLGLDNPAVELLVLSACRTAVGDSNAELGFAGLAVATGVKSALASLWYVSDEGTLGLMTEFYSHLNDAKIKAEALRRAQIAMLRGEVEIMDGFLLGLSTRGGLPLPPELAGTENTDLSHPYYWSGFTLIGSPW